MTRVGSILMTFLAGTMLTGCASVSMVASWRDQTAPPTGYRKFLVAGITPNGQMRQVFEEIFAGELRKRGVKAIPSYTVTGVEEKQSRESLEKAVQGTGVDAVITARVIDRKRETTTHVGYVMTSRGYTNTNINDAEVMPVDLFGFYGASVVSYATFDMKSVEVTSSRNATVETNIFDAATKKLVWSGTVNAENPEGIISVSGELAQVVIDAMGKEGLLR